MITNKKDIKYLNKDFAQFRASLVEYAKNYFPNTNTDFSEGSPAMMFIEMASYVGDVLSFYGDNQFNEGFLQIAQQRNNKIGLAQNLAYKVKNKIPATTKLDVYQLLPAKTVGLNTVPDFDYALTINSILVEPASGNSQTFRTTELVNFNVSSSFNPTEISVFQINDNTQKPEYYTLKKQVKVTAGNIKTETFDFLESKPYDKILLEDTDIIEVISITDSDNNVWYEVPYLAQETVIETVANTIQNDPQLSQYEEVPYLLKLKKTARRFITKFRADRRMEIQFGAGVNDVYDEEIIPNPTSVGMSLTGLQIQYDQPIDPTNFLRTRTYGLAPSNTTLTVKYSVGGGITSNVSAQTLTKITELDVTAKTGLDNVLLGRIKSSIACINPQPATGGKDEETIEEITQNALANFASQQRAITDMDYVVRTYYMPPKFGAIAKAYIIQDQLVNRHELEHNPLALNLYVLGYDNLGKLANINDAIKENLKNYLKQYRMLTDAVNIKNAYIINIGLLFEIIILPEYNSNEVLLKCISKLKEMFAINNVQINQPILISKIYTELDKCEGVQTVTNVEIKNLYGGDYSANVYDINAATRNKVIYPSLDPSIFEIKFPEKDIVGKVINL